MNGSYENLKGGSSSEAMEDFSGGVTEMFDLNTNPMNLFQIMVKAVERESMMGCSVDVRDVIRFIIKPRPHRQRVETTGKLNTVSSRGVQGNWNH